MDEQPFMEESFYKYSPNARCIPLNLKKKCQFQSWLAKVYSIVL